MRNLLLRFKAKVLLAVLMLISLYSSAQNEPWQEKMADPSVNIYEVKQSFDQAWQNRPITKGKGYKQYKRWEYFMEARCFPTGVRFAPDAVYVAMEQQPEMFAFNSQMPGSWTYIGNTSVPSGGGGAGRVNGIRPMPGSTTTFFACAPAGGLWKTTNSGASWSLLNTDGLASIGVSDVAIDPNNTNIMYIATGDGDAGDTYALGVLKTTDGGLTWNTTGLNWTVTNNRTTSRLLIDPSDSQKVIAATSNGIYRTINGGTSWTQVQTGSFKDLKFHPSNPLIVYATGASYYRSSDGGVTWTNITAGLPTTDVTRMALAVSANNSSYVYILAGKSSDAGMRGVYRSTDSGLTFTAQYTGPLNLMGWDPSGTDAGGQAWYDLVIEADPNDANVIYTGGVNVWKSSNGGTSWSIAGHWYGGGAPYVHADIHAMAFVPGTTRLLVGCDGGVFTTTDGGPNFSDISSNLQIAQQYRLSVSQTNANLVLSGWQDNGTNLKNGATWTRPIGGDGMECIINPTNSSIMYGELYYGDIRKSTNGGVSFPTQVCSSGGTGVNENGAWVTPYVLGSNPAHLYVGKTRVYKSTDNGATFTALGAIPGTTINALCVAPADNNYIYASKGGTLYKSTNNGTSFTAVSGLPGNYISYICTNSSNALEVYVTLSGFTSGVKVYKSTDAGATWTNISGSLPNIPANCIVYQTGSVDNALYVGTDAGVYYRDDVLGNWVPYMNGMPNVVVDELEIQYGTNTIVAATFGRGTWSAPLYALPQRDVTFVSIDSPVGTTCESLISPSFSILNAGENDVTSVTISYQVDANPVLTYTWTGTLATGGSVVITPPTYDYGNGAFTLTATITDVNGLGVDENTTNNSQNASYFVSGGANSVTLNLLTDCYPEETSWSVTQGGTVIFQGAGYAGATNNSITMCLDDGCFVLNVYDSYGDGLSSCATGDYVLTNDANGAILATMATANFGTLATHSFCLNVPTPGCTDSGACNYNPAATTDDGSCVFGPANDICTNATNFTVNGGAVTVINTTTCFDGPNPTCGGTSAIKDLWYKFTFTGGDITIQTSAGSSSGVAALTDTRIALFSSCGGTQIACNDDISGTNFYSRIIVTCAQLTVGQTYYVQVGGYNATTGVCSLNITRTDISGCTNPLASNYNVCATIDNGTCTGLEVLGCTNASACNYNASATTDDGSCVLPTTYYRDLDNDTYGNAAQTIQACSAPVGYVSNSTDCNDSNAAVHPGATEVCNTIDDDCDASIDEGVQSTFYRDLDNDTYGNAAQTIQACSAPVGYVSNSTDCNDSNAAVHPGATEVCNTIDDDCDASIDEGVQSTFYRDLDNDTYGNAAQTIQACSAPVGYVSNSTDCNDSNSAIHPGATEVCNTIDEDCDGSVDEGVLSTFYRDLDNDTYGNAAQTIQACSAPVGYVSNSTDCNDSNAAVHPGATEVCNTIDDDCDASIDEGVQSTFYRDLDNDTYGNAAQTIQACSAPVGYVSNSTDCNDNNAAINPGATELCNTIDDDCDGTPDDNVVVNTYYFDGDTDGYGNTAISTTSCTTVLGYVLADGDCDDGDPSIHPGATELCDGVDQDCDGTADDGLTFTTYYLDSDLDGYGNPLVSTNSCSSVAGYVTNDEDCDDSDDTIYPGATELCNGINDDCDGLLDEGCGTSYASNDNPASAQTVAVGTLYNCSSSVSGDLSNASPSGESLIACVTGEDLWYSFTALTPGVRIQVISNQNNIVIELQDMNGNLIDSENINGSLGNEILNFGGLTPGNQYLVAIRNFNSSQGIGTFSLCISKLIQTTCDYPGPNFSLCDWYKADYTGAHAYVFHFTPMDGGDAITVTKYGSTILPLTNVPGLQYEHDYQVTIDAVYQLTNGLLQPEFVTVAGSSVCDLNVGSPNLPGLRTNDQCPNMKTLYSYIQLTPGVCGASTYAWEVTRVDIPQLPVVVNTINSKFLQLKSTNGFVAGGVYNVRVSAVFGNNPPMHYGPVQCVQIVGSAGLTLEQEELTIEDSKNQDSDFVIFPNPTSSELNILPFVALNETVNIELLDQMGKIVYSESIYNLDGSIINVELPKEIASGLYLLHIENGDMSYQKKIVIEK